MSNSTMENTLSSAPKTRPESIDSILSSLDRYNPENIKVLQEYVLEQASSSSIESTDIAANLALLKLYQFNSSSAKDDIILIVLTKALVQFYTCDFSTAMHLLPAHVTSSEQSPLREQVGKLFELYRLLDGCKYSEFWEKFESDDSYADLVADVTGFEDNLRLSIAKTVSISCKQIATSVFKDWVNIGSDSKFKAFVEEKLGWKFVNDNSVAVPLNKDNDAKPVVTTETVRFEQLTKMIKHAYEVSI